MTVSDSKVLDRPTTVSGENPTRDYPVINPRLPGIFDVPRLHFATLGLALPVNVLLERFDDSLHRQLLRRGSFTRGSLRKRYYGRNKLPLARVGGGGEGVDFY